MEIDMNMKNAKTLAGLGLMLSLLGGCHHDDAPPKPEAKLNHAEDILPMDENRSEFRIMAAQTAAGNRADPTLYSAHFDGPMLTSLGTTKLDSMLHDAHSCDPLVVYLAVPDDQFTLERRKSISNYLMDRGGLKAEQIRFEQGPAPDTYSPAGPAMKSSDGIGGGGSTGAAPAAGGAAHY
jgi:hypothetical protein